MEPIYGSARCHGGGREDDDRAECRPNKRLRTTKSHAGILQPVTELVRHPLCALSTVFEGLGIAADTAREQLHLSLAARQRQEQLLRLREAKDAHEWSAAAQELDILEGANAWKEQDEDEEIGGYDPTLIRARLKRLQNAVHRGVVEDLRFQVRTALTRDLGGMGDIRLYRRSRIGTKTLIERYNNTAIEAIDAVVETAGLEPRLVFDLMKNTRQAFGRSALLLSGGGTLGMNHVGVVTALYHEGLLPRIISGASAGSIVCAILCTRTDEEMPNVINSFCNRGLDVFTKEGESCTARDIIMRFCTEGAIYDISNLKRVLQGWLGEMTFFEAYNRTQRILSICVSSAKAFGAPRLLNYITAPDVVIWSAVAASCSVPGVYQAATILAKDRADGELRPWDDEAGSWIDGSVDNDLPMARLAEMLNVNHFIVAQVNPHVVPFLSREEDAFDVESGTSGPQPMPSSTWMSTMANLAKGEALHRLHNLAELGILPTVATKLRSILGQRYAGDITILPQISYSQYPRILSNPTKDFMEQAMANGQRATWPKLSRIRNHLAIELRLDEAVRKMTHKVAFSASQADLRVHHLHRPRSPTATRVRGRSRRGSRGSLQSARSTILPRQELGRQAVHRPIRSMCDPPSTSPYTPAIKVPGPDASDYFSSADDSASPRSTSPMPESDADDEAVYHDSESPPAASPPSHDNLWPATRRVFSQPVTPSIASKTFAPSASASPASPRTPTQTAGSLSLTPSNAGSARPSSPEMRYKRLFHGRVNPMPTIRSEAGTPEPGDSGESKAKAPRKFSKLGLNIDLSGTKGIVMRRKRSLSTGVPGLKPPDRR